MLQTFEVTGQVLKDISYGKEDIPVSCVNSVDNSFPEYLEYSTRRLPQDGVSALQCVKLFLYGLLIDRCLLPQTLASWWDVIARMIAGKTKMGRCLHHMISFFAAETATVHATL